MRSGVDTDFLVAVELCEHARHEQAHALFEGLLTGGTTFVVAPQVLAEIVHIITDGRRFLEPLSMSLALERVQWWWNAREVEQVFPCASSTAQTTAWLLLSNGTVFGFPERIMTTPPSSTT